MRVPLAKVGRQGRMELTFTRQGEQTILRDAYCEVPYKITRIVNSEAGVAQLILMQCSAGLFGGDDVDASIRLEAGAQAHVSQQSATKVHPSQELPALQRLHLVVESGAELRWNMEPLIPFAESRLRQATRIDVADGGRLVFWEGFMTGRVSHGETWRFTELSSETQLFMADRRIYLDRFRLKGSNPTMSPWSMGSSCYAGTGLYVGDAAAGFASRIHEAAPEAGVDLLSDNVVLVRATAAAGPVFHRLREAFAAAASEPHVAAL